jgi:phosphoglycerol transferase MdoB-like AlkP superfamily enzyme
MGFDEFSRVAGIKHYFGMNEYKGAVAFDNNWGIFDDEFMQYAAGEISNLKQPFFTSLFTLSSHHPYVVPERYDAIIPKDEPPQLRSILYADLALRNFFSSASKMPWFENTLFVIVADHTAKVHDQVYNNPVGAFRIPIAFYHPGNDTLRGRRTDIAQQIDIMPSVIHYLGIEDSFLAFGHSVFCHDRQPFAINYLNNIYYYFQNNFMLSFDGENSLGLFNYITDKNLKSDLFTHQQDTAIYLETQLKAIIQDYQKRLNNNQLTNNIN